MVKIALQIKATFENVEKLTTNHPDFNFFLKLKCLNCGEQSDKWHDITESVTTETARSATNYQAKCKLCARENSMDILPGSNGDYTADDQGKFKTIVIFDCRGLEPIEFSPRDGWIVKIEESNKIFEDVDLTEKEWVEYDEKIKQSVGIYEFESQFIKVK